MTIKKLKVSFFIPTLDIGGIQRVFLNTSSLLFNAGYDVDFIICRGDGILQTELNQNINLITFGKNKRLRNSVINLVKYINNSEPDYLITGSDIHNHFAILCNFLSRRKTKVIATQHNYYDEDIKGKKIYRFFFNFLITKLYPQTYKVISVSESLHEYISKLSPKANNIKIHNPFCTKDILSKSEIPNIEFNLPDNYILFAGRLAKVKNLDLLISSFNQIKNRFSDFKLIIIGTGPELERLSKDNKNNQSIIFPGEVDHCYYLIKHAKVIALSSISETLPSILIESLFLKKTVVSTPTLGALEVLDHGKYGYLSNSIDRIDDFTEVLIESIDRPLNENLLFKRALDFSAEKILEQYNRILT